MRTNVKTIKKIKEKKIKFNFVNILLLHIIKEKKSKKLIIMYNTLEDVRFCN